MLGSNRTKVKMFSLKHSRAVITNKCCLSVYIAKRTTINIPEKVLEIGCFQT
jgi:hypothetical protein